MSTYTVLSSSTLPPKFVIACAAAMGFAVVSLFSGTVSVAPDSAPRNDNIVTLPTIVVVPDAADRAAAAALDTVVLHAPNKRLDEV
jgi:hypothetical protein